MQVYDSGTQVTTPGSEHVLSTAIPAGIYELHADIAALAGAEVGELRVTAPVLAAGTTRLVRIASFRAGSTELHTRSEPVTVPNGDGEVTLTQVGGSSRSIPWAIVQLDV